MGISEHTRTKWDERIEFLLDNGERLTEWEAEFVDSLSIRRSGGRDLTFKQSKILNRIFHRIEWEIG